MENNENELNKEQTDDKYFDQTSEMKLFRKGKRAVIVDDEDYAALENTREFRTAMNTNGNQVVRFNPKAEKGLTLDQVDERKRDKLTNTTKQKYQKTYVSIVLKNLFTVLNILLYTIAVIYACVGTDIMNMFFVLVVTANLVIGIYQECRAKYMVDKLSLVTTERTKVIRNSIVTSVDPKELVLDDIILLSTGNKIPSDSIIKEGNVEVNESLLTGEALPVKKGPDGCLFAGSFISSGSCSAKIERVGSDNYISQLQEKAKKVKNNNSQILKTLNLVIRVITSLIVPFALIYFFVSWGTKGWTGNQEEIKSIIETTCSSMVAMIPSGLYLLTSVTLFVSVIALAKKKALVNNTYSIETLARIDTLCLDKTGTITSGEMDLEKVISINQTDVDQKIVIGDLLGSFKERNETASALLRKFPATGTLTAVKTLPFSSSRKMSAVTFKDYGTYVVGAPEFILDPHGEICTRLGAYAQEGYRVLLLAYSPNEILSDTIPSVLKPVAAYIIKDHVREEAYDTIKWFRENEVEVKIISGDNPLTVSKIAEKVGVNNADKAISLEGMKLEEVAKAANEYTVFGRVAPEQKATLIQALRRAGHTVAMTGDGVNDILAMKQADCSIAMANGSEATRSVASLVLADSNFNSLPKVVKEGRRVINNVQDLASLFLMKTIFAMILTLTTVYPFVSKNLQILEFCVIGVPSVLLALQANPKRIHGGFLRNVLAKSLPAALALIISVVIPCIFYKFGVGGIPQCNIHSTDNLGLVTCAGIAMSITGLFVLIHRCLPIKTDISKPSDETPVYTYNTAWNWGRIGMWVIMVLIACVVIFTNYKVKGETGSFIAGYDIDVLSSGEWILLACSTLASCVIFEVCELTRKKIAKNLK